MKKLSVVIIARNEEANISRCLESVQWADEIIVGDSGSDDRTVPIAQSYSAKIVTYVWRGFGPAKQIVTDHAEGEWILSIDADEEVTSDLADEIRAAIADSGGIVGFRLPRRTQFLGRWIAHGGWYPDLVLRLYRRGRGRFTDAHVHEEVLVDGPTGCLGHDLLHYSYPNLDVYLDKLNKYTTLAAEDALRRGQTAGPARIIFNPLAKFLKQYILRAGFLDGREGLLLAVLSAGYVMTKYAKLWDLRRGRIRSRSKSDAGD
ncbi:MAG: glycosyltransferase family 2 protein [Candidatus Zixiibacteriota bacterium]